jgi:hypothetical protein
MSEKKYTPEECVESYDASIKILQEQADALLSSIKLLKKYRDEHAAEIEPKP